MTDVYSHHHQLVWRLEQAHPDLIERAYALHEETGEKVFVIAVLSWPHEQDSDQVIDIVFRPYTLTPLQDPDQLNWTFLRAHFRDLYPDEEDAEIDLTTTSAVIGTLFRLHEESLDTGWVPPILLKALHVMAKYVPDDVSVILLSIKVTDDGSRAGFHVMTGLPKQSRHRVVN